MSAPNEEKPKVPNTISNLHKSLSLQWVNIVKKAKQEAIPIYYRHLQNYEDRDKQTDP